jgi:hypothetical protein
MLILVPCLLLFATTLILIALRAARPAARFAWLAAVAGSMLAFASVFFWLAQMPIDLTLPAWQPAGLFISRVSFRADGLSWPMALSVTALTLTMLLTAVARPVVASSYTWAGALMLGGIGILAVTADNPLTLLLVWAALDITELLSHLVYVQGAANNEKVVISFSTRALGIGILLWANISSIASGNDFNFQSMPSGSGIFLVMAAGLRLGVLPLHLPYSAESTLRRGFGTSLRLTSAVSSLMVLAHIPAESSSAFTPILLGFAVMAAIYGGWMWLRAPDELTGRPYWVIGLAALSVIAALSGSPVGAVAWGCALILVGGALFLASVQQAWLNRALLAGAWSLSALPFSLTAGAWTGNLGFSIPFVVAAQALLTAGFIRHALRPSGRDSLESQPAWTRAVYPAGIILLIACQILLGFFGWDGALQIGAWVQAAIASLLTFGLVWATARLRILNPVSAHWVKSPAASRMDEFYGGIWTVYRLLGSISQAINTTLEGESGIMWTLLFLVIFVSLLTQGLP